MSHPSNRASWLLHVPFAAVLLVHGTGKLVTRAMSSDMLGLSLPLVLLVGAAEVLAGLGAIIGGLRRVAAADLVTRLAGLAAAPVLIGAIATVHGPRWSFTPSASHPMGGMEFQVVLLGIAAYVVVVGARRTAGSGATCRPATRATATSRIA